MERQRGSFSGSRRDSGHSFQGADAEKRTQLPPGSRYNADAEAAELAEELAHLRLHVIPQLQRELQDSTPSKSGSQRPAQSFQASLPKEGDSEPQRQTRPTTLGRRDERGDGLSDSGELVEHPQCL